MTVSWTQQRERGNRTLLQLMTWLSLRGGWRIGRILLVPITAYFYLFSVRGRRASRDYLALALGRPPRRREIFRHFLTFSSTVLDRPFLLTGNLDDYEIELIGIEHIVKWRAQGKGCILLGSHLGSFEVLRAMAEDDNRFEVRALMHEKPSATTELFRTLNPGVADKIIPIGSVSTMLRVKEALEAGEMVGMLGDRTTGAERMIETDFLGRPAAFPVGPFVLASLLQAPVVLCFGLYCGGRRYEIHFEPFAEQIVLRRGQREAALRVWVEKFAGRLADHCRKQPYNWFNFYDFWEPRSS